MSQTAVILQAMSGPGLFSVVVIGLVAGAVARALVDRRGSTFSSLLLGTTGALVAACTAEALGLPPRSPLAFALTAATGATALLCAVAIVRRPR